jgi:hypothetical protein
MFHQLQQCPANMIANLNKLVLLPNDPSEVTQIKMQLWLVFFFCMFVSLWNVDAMFSHGRKIARSRRLCLI